MGRRRRGPADLGRAAVRLTGGRLFALYVATYTVGRAWVEALRVDHANHILGLRLNDWTSLVVFLGAVIFLLLHRRSERAGEPAPALTESK